MTSTFVNVRVSMFHFQPWASGVWLYSCTCIVKLPFNGFVYSALVCSAESDLNVAASRSLLSHLDFDTNNDGLATRTKLAARPYVYETASVLYGSRAAVRD